MLDFDESNSIVYFHEEILRWSKIDHLIQEIEAKYEDAIYKPEPDW